MGGDGRCGESGPGVLSRDTDAARPPLQRSMRSRLGVPGNADLTTAPALHPILRLQRAAGNAAVARVVLQRCGGEVHEGCACAVPPESMGVVQRAKIDHGTLTWADFKGAKPAKFPAATYSGMKPVPKKLTAAMVADTSGPDCTAGKKTLTETTVKATVDGTTFDAVKSYMDQAKSGADPDYKKGLPKETAKEVKACNKAHAKQSKETSAEAVTDCKEHIAPCKQAFADGETSFSVSAGKETIEVTKKKDCSTKALVNPCRDGVVADTTPGAYELEFTNGDVATACPSVAPAALGTATAATKADCDGSFKEKVAAMNNTESARLLAHEQVHFDLTEKAAVKLRADLGTAAAPLSAEGAGCGEKAATGKAKTAFAALDRSTLDTAWQDAETERTETQKRYDDETCHGLDQTAQDAWS